MQNIEIKTRKGIKTIKWNPQPAHLIGTTRFERRKKERQRAKKTIDDGKNVYRIKNGRKVLIGKSKKMHVERKNNLYDRLKRLFGFILPKF